MERKGPVRPPPEKGASRAVPARPLGAREAFFHRVHEELFGGPSVLCVSARVAGPLDIQLVKHACHRIWERHPALKARIVSTEGKLSFLFNVPFHDIPIHSFFELGRTNLHTVLEREVDTLFDASKHLWRVLLITDRTELKRHYLLLSLHHSISDGTSAVRLAEELISCCARILSGEAPRMDPLPLRAPLEELLASTGGTSRQTGTAAGRPPGESGDGSIPYHEFQPPGRRHTRFRVHTMGAAETAVLEEKCLRAGTSIHAALAASALTVMRKRFGDDVRFSLTTPVNVRRLTGTAIGDCELWCMEAPVSIHREDIGGHDTWQMARDYSNKLAFAASSGVMDLSARANTDPAEEIEGLRAARYFPLSCLLLEEGRVGQVQKGHFLIENMGLVSGRQAAEHITAISATTAGDVLSLTFAYTSPLLKESWADRFMSEFLHNLKRMVKYKQPNDIGSGRDPEGL